MQNTQPGWRALALALSFSIPGAGAFAGAVSVGSLGPANSYVLGPSSGGTTTLVDLVRPVIGNGELTSATLIWAGGPCAAGFRLSFFRPEIGSLTFLGDRGPFDVTGGFQRVALAPGFPVQAGDLIGISVVRSDCGAPYLNSEGPAFRTAIFGQTIHADVLLCEAFEVTRSLELEASGGADEVYAGTVPGAGSAAGQSGGNFKTGMQLTNSGIFPIAGHLVFHPITPGADSTLPYALTSFQTVSYPDIVAAMGTTGLGSIDVFTASGYAPLVSTRVFNDQGAAGTAGFSEPFVQPDDDFLLSGDTHDVGVLVGPEDVTRFRYNFGVRAFEAGASIDVLVFDPDGAGVLHVTRTFAPNQFVQLSARDFLQGTDITANQSFRIDVSAGSILVYGVTIDNTTNDTAFRLASRRRR